MASNTFDVDELIRLSGYSAYSGCDIIPVVYGINASTGKPDYFAIGDIATLTYSIHRDKGAVRTLGRVNPKSFVRGQRTIAGTMVFNVFNRRALYGLSKGVPGRVRIADSLPGFDIIVYFQNEYGSASTLIIYNVQIVDEGQSHSVQDMYVENTMSYVASDIHLLEPILSDLTTVTIASAGIFTGMRDRDKARGLGSIGEIRDYSYLRVEG